MNETSKKWEAFLDPASLQDKLVSASLYVMAFEILKESICGRIRTFYLEGFGDADPASAVKYKSEVLSRNKSTLYASLEWLVERDAIDQSDLSSFEDVKTVRNELAHELQSYVLGGESLDIAAQFQTLAMLLRKIEIWWVMNVEIPTNPDFDGVDVAVDEVIPGPVLMLQLILDVATGNQELLARFSTAMGERGS